MKWEYQLAMGRFEAIGDLHQRLNALGRAGWEAVGLTQYTQTGNDVTILLKRRHRPSRPPEPSDTTTHSA